MVTNSYDEFRRVLVVNLDSNSATVLLCSEFENKHIVANCRTKE